MDMTFLVWLTYNNGIIVTWKYGPMLLFSKLFYHNRKKTTAMYFWILDSIYLHKIMYVYMVRKMNLTMGKSTIKKREAGKMKVWGMAAVVV